MKKLTVAGIVVVLSLLGLGSSAGAGEPGPCGHREVRVLTGTVFSPCIDRRAFPARSTGREAVKFAQKRCAPGTAWVSPVSVSPTEGVLWSFGCV